MEYSYPLFEHDQTVPAVIEPSKVLKSLEAMPDRAIILFYQGVIDTLLERALLTHIDDRRSEVGLFPVYSMEYMGRHVAILNPGIGAPAAVGFFEELIAMGVNKAIGCGSCGVLRRDIPRGEIVVVDSAVRDEGTSYHYLQPSREVPANERVLKKVEETLRELAVPFLKGKTWTTDAFYRETRDIVQRRLQEDCITVEMEASALMAVAQFRSIDYGQLLSTGDDVSGEDWDRRFHPEAASHKERVFWAAVECCVRL